jgi:tetratricopeptide (TPR) repeat protein
MLVVWTISVCLAQENAAESLIESGHWKRARVLVERRLQEAPDDPQAAFLASQIHNAFGDHTSPAALAEKAVRLDGRVARYHRQLAEVQGVMAQHAGLLQQVLLARRFRKEIDAALELDPRDTQALRDLLEFYLLAPGVVGGDVRKAAAMAQRIAAIDEAEGFLGKARIAGFRKDRAQMEAMLRRAAEVHPASYKAQIALGSYLASGHRDDSSAEAFGKAAVGLDAGRIDAYCLLAEIYAGRSDWVSLEDTLSAAVRAVPDDAAPYYRAAERLLSEDREAARAERYLRIYISREPEGNQPTAADAAAKLDAALRAQRQDANSARSARNGGVK